MVCNEMEDCYSPPSLCVCMEGDGKIEHVAYSKRFDKIVGHQFKKLKNNKNKTAKEFL